MSLHSADSKCQSSYR